MASLRASLCDPPSFVPLHLQDLWSELSAGLCASIISQRVSSVRVFRELWDGSEEDAVDFIGESGGVLSDAPILHRLRSELKPAADLELRHIANSIRGRRFDILGMRFDKCCCSQHSWPQI